MTDRKKINLNLSNKIINENFKKQDIINSKSIKMEKDEVKITMLALMWKIKIKKVSFIKLQLFIIASTKLKFKNSWPYLPL